MENCPNLFSFTSMLFWSQSIVAFTTCELGSINFVTFWNPGECCLPSVFLCFPLLFFPSVSCLSTSRYILPCQFISIYIRPPRPPDIVAKLHLNPQNIWCGCLSTGSCQTHQHEMCSAPEEVKPKHTQALYIDEMSRFSRDKALSKSKIQSTLSWAK